MWNLYALTKVTYQRPSDIIGIRDRWAAYQFDSAVALVGTTIENALQETVKAGEKTSPRYTLAQLLNADFRLPRDPPKPNAVDALKKIASKSKSVRYHKVE